MRSHGLTIFVSIFVATTLSLGAGGQMGAVEDNLDQTDLAMHGDQTGHPDPITPEVPEGSYDFDHLWINQFIDGKDNWIDQDGQGLAWTGLDETQVNGSVVVRPLPTVAYSQSAYISRVNDESYSFPAFDGTETEALIQFDVQGEYLAMFALGTDTNGDGMLTSAAGEIGPAFGTDNRMFLIQGANMGAITQVEFGSGNSGSDWYRMRLVVDFTANDGRGMGSLLYRNLTDSHTEFKPVAGLQGIDLQMDRLVAGSSPESWNCMWVHLRSGGGNHPAADYLVPRVSE